MSQVVIEIARANFGGIGVLAAKSGAVEEITSSGTSQATTIEAVGNDFATIHNNGVDAIWVAFGASPIAAAGAGRFIPPNTTRDFAGLNLGDKVAVINDS